MSGRVMNFGRDKVGRATIIVRTRLHKPGEYDMDTMTRFGVFMIHKTIRLTEQYGHKQFVALLDRQGMTKANQDLRFMTSFI
jgi:hypothetical protein